MQSNSIPRTLEGVSEFLRLLNIWIVNETRRHRHNTGSQYFDYKRAVGPWREALTVIGSDRTSQMF